MYAALDLGQKTVRAVLKRQDGKIVKELTMYQIMLGSLQIAVLIENGKVLDNSRVDNNLNYFRILLKLSPRKYKYNTYMISPVDVLFL
jgi:hypothetical protein